MLSPLRFGWGTANSAFTFMTAMLSGLSAVHCAHARDPAREMTPRDSVWAANVARSVAPLLRDPDLLAVRASTSDSRSAALAAALAVVLDVPGRDTVVISPDSLPTCARSAVPGPRREPRGAIASVRWKAIAADRAFFSVRFECLLNGRPFIQRATYTMSRSADGLWRAIGAPVLSIS
jgi:hypothetical protein